MSAIAFETPQFRADYRRASKQTQEKIEAFIDKFEESSTRGGLRLKTPETAANPAVKVARVDQGLRAVLVDIGAGQYILHRVMEHDAAYRAASTVQLDVNAVNGLPRLIEAPQLAPAAQVPEDPRAVTGLFEHRRDRDFEHVGVPRWAVAMLRSTTDRAAVEQFADTIGEGDPLVGLAIHALLDEHRSVDEIFAELIALEGVAPPDVVAADETDAVTEALDAVAPVYDPADVRAALERPGAAERFRVVEDSQELIEALRGDFGDWQVFLHPLQRQAAYHTAYNGPARVSGGAGTGKTVVLIHRVKALLDRAADGQPPRILLTTLTKHLKQDLETLLVRLVGQDHADLVDLTTVDELAQDLHERMGGDAVEHISREREHAIWVEIAARYGAGRSSTFLRNEYRHVLLARGVRSLANYLAVARAGRGVRLDAAERRALWPAFEAFEARTRAAGRATTLQLTEQLAATFQKLPAPLYDHVLVDEAQDLHASQWRLLRSIVAPGPDDLFLAGDVLQRIYGDTVSLRSVGIETRGRSVRLRRNYRTTHEIVAWALGLVGDETVVDLDELGADLHGYHSVRHGPAPAFVGFATRDLELQALSEQVRTWLAEDRTPDSVVVAARTGGEVKDLVTALQRAGILAGELGRRGRLEGVVNVATMHRLKGLEYRCVALTGLAAGNVPHEPAICSWDDDPSQHRADVLTERSLVYVAATRARDHLSITWSGEPSELFADTLRALDGSGA